MKWLGGIRERFRHLFMRASEDAERDEELRIHMEMEIEANLQRGMTIEEAKRKAALSFGGVERIREEVREARGLGALDDWVGDVRYALRALRKNPGFTTVALLTLALGIGANTAMFSIVNGVLLRSLAYPHAEELVRVHQASPKDGELHGRVSFQDMEDFAARARSLEAIAGFANLPTILTGQGDPVEIEFTYVTTKFFPLLGVNPALGRPLQEEDHRQALPNVVISDAMWRTYLGADPQVIGRVIQLRGEPFTVVGVMPAGMSHPTPETAVWAAQSLVRPNMFSNGVPRRGDRYLQAVARLAPNTTAESAQQELSALARELAGTYPESNTDWNAATVVPLLTSIVGDVDKALVIVLGVVGFILLIGCANLANLLLARGSARRREIAIRTALGAGRARIVRQLLTESLVLALLGGVLGLLLSYWGVRAALALSADTLPRIEDVRLDGRVIAFTLLLATLTGVLFGLIPALRTAQAEPQNDLRGGRGTMGTDGHRLRNALVVAEVALAVLLVVGAGLMTRSFVALRSVDTGFKPDQVLAVALQLNLAGVPGDQIPQYLIRRRQEYISALRELPGVTSAGAINVFPLREDGDFAMEYTPARPDLQTRVNADTRYVDPGYFKTMGIALLRGDTMPHSWPRVSPVPALLSASSARQLFPNSDAIGQLIKVPWGESVVVGVVADVRQHNMEQTPEPAIYFPHNRAPRLLATIVVRSAGDPLALVAPVRQAIKAIDPNQPIRSILPLRTVMSESIAEDRFFTVLFALFGGLALLLAAVGIYGVLAYSVRQRTQEIGVRMAMGANALDVLKMVAGAGMKLVLIGIIIGTTAALMLTRVLASQLYGITATDPVAFAAGLAFLGVVAFMATYIPAYRATRVTPMIALRPD
jgi:predicted permease